MSNPRTIYEVLELLENYFDRRLANYQRLARKASDPEVHILLEYLVKLEEQSAGEIRNEMKDIDPEQATYLTSGPVISTQSSNTTDFCDRSSFEETLSCVLASDQLLDELLHRLEGGSAAPVVLHLAERLREFEEIKNRQIANFTRQD